MRRSTIAAIAAVSAIAFTQIASAADLPRKAPAYMPPPLPVVYNWTGCYLGANVGGHWGRDEISTTTSPAGAEAAFIDSVTATTLKPQGVIGGVQGGCNYQVSSFVFGIEADADWLGGTESRNLVLGPNTAVVNPADFIDNSTKATFIGTARGRVGAAFDRLLVFATGGVAFGRVETTDTFGSFGGTSVVSTNDTTSRTGWTVGGGVEYAFANNWTTKVEYLYVDLGSSDTNIPPCGACVRSYVVHHNYTDNIVRVGLNYKFF
jgi:outer membrane immunogenic protein